MGTFNNFGKFDAEDEAARRRATMEDFLASDNTHLLMVDGEPEVSTAVETKVVAAIPTVKIENHSGFYSADCPNCGKTKILSSELVSLSAVCNKCYFVFNLEK